MKYKRAFLLNKKRAIAIKADRNASMICAAKTADQTFMTERARCLNG